MYRFLIYNGGLTEKGNQLNAKTAREQVSGKLDLNVGTVQKYLLKGMEELIGDCNGIISATFVYFTAVFYHIFLYLLNIRT